MIEKNEDHQHLKSYDANLQDRLSILMLLKEVQEQLSKVYNQRIIIFKNEKRENQKNLEETIAEIDYIVNQFLKAAGG